MVEPQDLADPPVGEDDDSGDDAPEWREALVDARGHGSRLDRFLVGVAPEFSRSYLQVLVEAGHVRIDGEPARTASRKLRIGQEVRVQLVPTAQSRAFRPEEVDFGLVYEDADLLVIDKPAGLVVHPAAGHWTGTLLNGLLARDPGAAALPRAGIVHRLDKDTSGLMVVARTLQAMTSLVHSIAARDAPVYQRQVLAIHAARLQLAHEVGLRGHGFRDHEQPARVLVETMHDPGARHGGKRGGVVQQRVASVPLQLPLPGCTTSPGGLSIWPVQPPDNVKSLPEMKDENKRTPPDRF